MGLGTPWGLTRSSREIHLVSTTSPVFGNPRNNQGDSGQMIWSSSEGRRGSARFVKIFGSEPVGTFCRQHETTIVNDGRQSELDTDELIAPKLSHRKPAWKHAMLRIR